jgi:alkanesulfonate monooxygenase
MSVEFIGYTGSNNASEIHPPTGPAIDREWVKKTAQAHEDGGFDRVLVAQHSTGPDSQVVTSYAAANTKRIGFLLAHRPGFEGPALAARKLASIDQFAEGRLAVHIITGGADAEMQRDGDFLSKDERYQRTDEYLSIVRHVWTSEKPFDHEGKYYTYKGAFSEVKSPQKPHLPIYFGGSSEIAIDVAGKHADVYAFWGEPLAAAAETIRQVRAAAAKYGRTIRFSLSLRPILAYTEAAAWERAESIRARTIAIREKAGLPVSGHRPPNVGSQRLLDAAALGERLDKRLWTGVAAVTGAQGNSTSLVGTPDQVAESLLDYYDIGVTTFLIRGFDPLEDAIDYGANLIPRVRRLVANRGITAKAS